MVGVVALVGAACRVWREQWLAGTWLGVALADGRFSCAASAMIWSAGAAGWAEAQGEEGSVARSMTMTMTLSF